MPNTLTKKSTWALVIAVAMVFMLPTLMVGYEWIADRVSPVTSSSLVFGPVELGALQPGEKRSAACEIRNQATRAVRLLPAKVSCGCLSLVDNAASVLEPGQSKTLRFTVQSPAKPKVVDEQILLQAEDSGSLFWKIAVRGEVKAKVWADPVEVELLTNSSGIGESVFRIHYDEDTSLGEVRADSAALQLDSLSDRNGVRTVRIAMSPNARDHRDAGEAIIQVKAADDSASPLLKIPVAWRQQPAIEWIPHRLKLTDYRSISGYIRASIVVRGLASPQRLEVEPLQSWVRVAGQDVRGNLIEVQLAFDAAAMPQHKQGGDLELLRLCPKEQPCETVMAYVRR